ncbi:hypothetical protein [Actinophytocola algeriensis]|uniref:Uncharacterized protein n=1 Tax=Actinophytocola algeriensis TaxID=1768010 RepID=A0A7W7Q9K8_9PSEU|nr:hypothetical protein [Actinophytocola algeriensis]MBB4909184.1 hypothetical protein [Actinophytocola algeriensis]MBE1474428.1 hypothetical protein [Actinophytocola algeriensis]
MFAGQQPDPQEPRLAADGKTGPTTVTSRTVFHDNIAIGTSFAEVDPSVAR